VRGHAAEGRLACRLPPRIVRFRLEMWLALHEDLRASRRVRLLFDHLAEELGRYADD
jgi:DNA-binding transcriptional LysR family regulator